MIGIHPCPECGTEKKFPGLCDPCRKADRAGRREASKEAKPKRRREYRLEPRQAGKTARAEKEIEKAKAKGATIVRGSSLKRRTRVKARSDRRTLEDAALKGLKVILGPFVKKCLRCERPNPAGTGFLSATNPRGLEFHHLFRRRGWFFFLGVPLCRDCHEEVEHEGEAARRDRWVIPEPIKANRQP